MRDDPPAAFIVVDDDDEENGGFAASDGARPDRRGVLRLRREAMRRDGLRRSRSWSYIGAIVLFAGSLQLVVSILRTGSGDDRLTILLPPILFVLMLFAAFRLLRRGRKLTRVLEQDRA